MVSCWILNLFRHFSNFIVAVLAVVSCFQNWSVTFCPKQKKNPNMLSRIEVFWKCKLAVLTCNVCKWLCLSPRGHIQDGFCLLPCFPGSSSPSRYLKLLQFREHSSTNSILNILMNKKISGSWEVNGQLIWKNQPQQTKQQKKNPPPNPTKQNPTTHQKKPPTQTKTLIIAKLNFLTYFLLSGFVYCCTLASFLQCLPPHLVFLWFVFLSTLAPGVGCPAIVILAFSPSICEYLSVVAEDVWKPSVLSD